MPPSKSSLVFYNSSRRASLIRGIGLAICCLCWGCGGSRWIVGNRTLYPPDIRTVYVPIIESSVYRRELGEQLTAAVVRQIELRTPFKVVADPEADSILTARLTTEAKAVLVKPTTDEQRLTQQSFQLQVTWTDRRGTMIRQPGSIAVPASTVVIDQTSNYMVEVGQSITTAQQQSIEKLAAQIVGLMESPW